MSHTREQHKEMITHPMRWPLLVLPLVQRGHKDETGFPQCGIFNPPLVTDEIPEDQPIKIFLCTLYDKLSEAETKTYPDVDALLDDGWEVD